MQFDDTDNELLSLFSGYFEDNRIDFVFGTSSSSVMHTDFLEQEFPVVQLSAGFDSRIGQPGDNLSNVDVKTVTSGTRVVVNIVTQLAMSEDWPS